MALPLKRHASSSDLAELADLVVPTRSKRATRLALRADASAGVVRLVIPEDMPEHQAFAFAAEHISWIKARAGDFQKKTPFADGATLPVMGHDHTLTIVGTTGATTITMEEGWLTVATKRADPSSNIRRFLTQKLEERVVPLAREKAAVIGKKIARIGFRDTSSRWGSCSSDGNLMFSWRLVFAPDNVIDYVVAHEIAHLKHMDHSPRFWALCEKLSADYANGKTWLRRNGSSLLRYGQGA